MAKNPTLRYLPLFERFVQDIRISSKETLSSDVRGTPLIMWDSQKRFLREVGQGLDDGIHKFNCLKSRQLGVTTLSLAIDAFWLALHPNIIGCLVTDDDKKREANRALLVQYISNFPEGYFGDSFRIVRNNRTGLGFSNGARLDLLVAGTKKKSMSWAEGVGYTFAHMTEVSSYGDVEGLKSLEEGFAQTAPERLFMYESTAKGFNHWRARWFDGLHDKLTQRSFFMGWWAGDTNRIERKDPRFAAYGGNPDNEERELMDQVARLYQHKITPEQLAWIRWKESSAGSEQELLSQNQPWTHEQAFVQTGRSFFQVRVVGQDIKRVKDSNLLFKGYRYNIDGDFFNFSMQELDPEVDSIEDVELKVWAEPVDDGQYVIGFDPAYGRNDHKDGHAIVVFRCFADRIVQVAEYVTNDVDTRHATWVLFHLAAAYRNCMVNVEIGGPGQMIMPEFDHLRQLLAVEANAARVAARDWQDAGGQARWYLYHRPDSLGAGYMANFETTWRTKSVIMHQLRSAYISNEIDICSLALLHEMTLVNETDGQIGAPESADENSKDDRVFALALATKAWIDWVRKDMLAQNQTYEILMAVEKPVTPLAYMTNSIVAGFLKQQGELADMPPEVPLWRSNLGI